MTRRLSKKQDEPFCEGFVQRVRNWTTVSKWVRGLERQKDLVPVADELLRNFNEFSNFVGHDGWNYCSKLIKFSRNFSCQHV